MVQLLNQKMFSTDFRTLQQIQTAAAVFDNRD